MINLLIIDKINEYLEIPDSSEPAVMIRRDSISYTWPVDAYNADPYPYKLVITSDTVTVDHTDQQQDKFAYKNDAELYRLIKGICYGIFWGYDDQYCGIDELRTN